jgi:hypothetical protein
MRRCLQVGLYVQFEEESGENQAQYDPVAPEKLIIERCLIRFPAQFSFDRRLRDRADTSKFADRRLKQKRTA